MNRGLYRTVTEVILTSNSDVSQMNIDDIKIEMDVSQLQSEMTALMERLYPICRSITGNGVRDTLSILKEYIPLTIHEVPTGTDVFDWKVPKEWNIRDAYIKDSGGRRVIDFKESNLHVVGYSVPVHAQMPLARIKEHIHTLPDYPEWIPYRTSYYKENWGFCMAHSEFAKLREDEYEVYIDSSLEDGHLSYGECYLEGQLEAEVLISCHVCHPSLCNDNVSGMTLVALLGRYLKSVLRRYSYRIIIIPGTIGAITWLALNEGEVHRIKHGLVVTCEGDPGHSTYKRSRRGDAEIDKAVEHVLKHSNSPYTIADFTPYGYDERQYCSPGFNLPVGCLQRTPHGQYPEYHTSADNLDFVRTDCLSDSFMKFLSILRVIEHNRKYISTNPKCEPQLGKRGLYSAVGGQNEKVVDQMSLLWVLNYSDGQHTLLDIAEKSGIHFDQIFIASNALIEAGLLKEHQN